jgi:hypothetical protein
MGILDKPGLSFSAAQRAALGGNQGVPLVQDAVTGVVYDRIGSITPMVSFSAITNIQALLPIAQTLMSATSQEVYITATGDSLIQLGGDTAAQSSDVLAERDGFVAQLRTQINSRLGTPDGGQWLPAQASPSDTRVSNSGSPVIVANWGPYNAYRNSSSVTVSRSAISLESAGHNISWTVYGRYLDVEIWENAPTYVGTASWTVDGSGGGTINSNGGAGATDTYRTVRLDLGSDASHVVSVSWATGKVLATGATITRGRGVVSRRFGFGGSKASTWTGLSTKVQRTSFSTLVTHLHIIRFSFNDWANQVADGLSISGFTANVQSLITLALANTNVKSVLLVADPVSSTADNKSILYRQFSDALKGLAVGKVAFYDVDASTNSTYNAGNTAGYYVDFVHRTGAGYAAEARYLAEALINPSLLKT